MRFACEEDEDIRAFLETYDSIAPSDQPHVPWEAVALAANVKVKHLVGAIYLATKNYCANTSMLIAISNHPGLTKKRVEYGLLPNGERDRQALDIMVGAQPTAKGPTFINKAVFGSSQANTGEDDDDEEQAAPMMITTDDDLDSVFPPSHAMQEKLVPIRQRLLNPPNSQ